MTTPHTPTRASQNAVSPDTRSEGQSAPAAWAEEREMLLEMLSQQQRVAQAGLMTAGLVHELMNHVAAIKGNADLALLTGSHDEMAQALRRASDRCTAISETTHTLLGFVRRRRSNAERTPAFDAGEAIRQTEILARPLAKEGGVVVEAHTLEDAPLRGDKRGLTQCLVNLVANAIRACKDRDDGKVTLGVSRPQAGTCRIRVADNGPGIPDEMRKLLFRPFATGHADSGGNGLGMFVVRQAVRKFGGSIRVATSPAGTTFQIDLPADTSAGACGQEQHTRADSNARLSHPAGNND